MKKSVIWILAMALVLALCGCSGNSGAAQPQEAAASAQEVQYDYELKAGENVQVSGMTFDEMVTVTVDPASTRNGGLELRSSINFEDCAFNRGLTVLGDYHAMITLGAGCTFGEGAVVTCKEVTAGSSREMTLEDNFVKITVSCPGVTVETECAVGVVSDGPDVVFNGTTYSKAELAPDTDFLGVYSTYQEDTLTYTKLAIGADDSVAILE